MAREEKNWQELFTGHVPLLRLAGGLVFLGLFVRLTFELFEGPELAALDRQILAVVGRLRLAPLNGPVVELTALGSATVVTLAVALCGLVLWVSRERLALFQLIVASAGAGLLAKTLKILISRPRPDVIPPLVEVTSFSYPSGHTLASTATYCTLALIACRFLPSRRQAAAVLGCGLALAALVGLSRIYLGVHYPSDVASAYFLGLGWALLVEDGMLRLGR